MKATLALFLLASFLCAQTIFGDSESTEQKTRRNTCGGLVEEPPTPSTAVPSSSIAPSSVPTPPPGECVCTPASPTEEDGEDSGEGDFHSKCILIQAFYNMSLSLTIEEQVVWEAWIQEMENDVLANMSLSNDQKVVLISLSLKAFFSVNIEMYKKLSYVKISDWGYVVDFLYVDITIQIEITQSIVTKDGNGNCDLTDALEEAADECDCSAEEKSAMASLIVEVKAILGDSSYTYEQQLAVVFELFEAFFVQNPSLEKKVRSIKIKDYGSMESFLRVCKTYKQITTLSVVLSGSSSDDCELLAALDEAATNSSFTTSQQAQILQLKGKLQTYFSSTTDLALRLKYVSSTCYQMFLLEPWMIPIIEQISCGEWGNIYELIFSSGICTNHGCGNPNDGPGPKQQSTSVAPSTQVPPANCATIGDLIVVDSNNATVLTTTLTVAYNSWTASQKLGFNSCFNKVRNAIWNNVQFPTQSGKLLELQKSFWQYNNNSVTNQQLVFNLTIQIWKGTIGQFVSCIH